MPKLSLDQALLRMVAYPPGTWFFIPVDVMNSGDSMVGYWAAKKRLSHYAEWWGRDPLMFTISEIRYKGEITVEIKMINNTLKLKK